MILGDTKPIGVAYRDQDLEGSRLTTPAIVAPQFDLTALTTATTPLVGTEVVPVVQSGVTQQLPVASIFTANHYGAFQDNTTQTNVGIGLVPPQANVMTFDTVDFAYGVSRVNNSRLKVSRAGVYDIQFSSQFSRAGGGGGISVVEAWLSKNGTAIPDSNTQLSIYDNGGKAVMALNFFVQAAVNDYYELYWYSSDANVQMWSNAAGTNPARPAIPSVIVTVAQVA